jgi:hypothetical protein
LHEQELIDTELGTGADARVRERPGTGEDHRGGQQEQARHQEPVDALRQPADGGGRADQVGLFDLPAGTFHR